MIVLPALLAAAAAGVAAAPDRPSERVGQLLPRLPEVRRAADAAGPHTALVRGAAALAGLAVWALLGGLVGLVLGVAAAVVAPQLLSRLDRGDAEDAAVTAELPLALDLLAACLAGGATAVAAVQAVAAALPGPCGRRLARVAAALDVGSAPSEAWAALGRGPGPAAVAARALARAAEGGAPVAASVLRVAEDARREAAGRAERAARRAGVLAVGPLGLCFLPAFLLLAVVPAVIGLATPLLASL